MKHASALNISSTCTACVGLILGVESSRGLRAGYGTLVYVFSIQVLPEFCTL